MTANAMILLLGVCCCCCCGGGADVPGGAPELAYDWDVAGDAVRGRLKIWDGALFMAVPRSERAAPATLLRYNESESPSDAAAPKPFPTAGMQTESNCFGLQNARDIEIDHLGHLWMLDAAGATVCEPKLFVADAHTGAAVRSAVVPGHLYTSRAGLAGLALHLGTLTAVVADVGSADPGFIVYGWQTGVFRKFPCDKLRQQHGTTGGGDDGSDGGDYDVQLVASPIDGLLYFTANRLASVFAIPWTVFDVARGSVDRGHPVGHNVIDLGPKEDRETATMILDTAGAMYLGAGRAVVSWNTLSDGLASARPFATDDRLARIAGLALDPNGYLWIASASSDAAAASRMKIFKAYCGETSFALVNSVAGDAAINFTGPATDHNTTRRPPNAMVAVTGRPNADDADYDAAAAAADAVIGAIDLVAVGAGLAAFVAARST